MKPTLPSKVVSQPLPGKKASAGPSAAQESTPDGLIAGLVIGGVLLVLFILALVRTASLSRGCRLPVVTWSRGPEVGGPEVRGLEFGGPLDQRSRGIDISW